MRPSALLTIAAFVVSAALPAFASAQTATTVNPNKTQAAQPQRSELSETFLKRIRAVTDTFEPIDGISYDQAVNIYKRDTDAEANIALWEEILKAYKSFCRSRCKTDIERMDVYRVLLLRSMFSEDEALKQAKPRVLTPTETRAAMHFYRLAPKPIDMTPAH
ncbi:MAG: hypothetical protein V4634_00400 [Pseudomonadota bacterium]